VLPELKKLAGKKIVCIHGDREEDSLCSQLPQGLAQVITTKGGHHFGGDYASLAETIRQAAE
jgi:type IV secretory pathway VirJ component